MRIVANLATRHCRAIGSSAFRRTAAPQTGILGLTAHPVAEEANRPNSVGICTNGLHAVAVDGMPNRRLVTRASRRFHERSFELGFDLLDARCIDGQPIGRCFRVADELAGRVLAGRAQAHRLARIRASIWEVASDDVGACVGDGPAHRRISEA
jgi:hypothetical protein